MTVPRRSFLRSGAMTVLLTTIALDSIPLAFARKPEKSDPKQDLPSPSEAKQGSSARFKREAFQPHVGGVFKLSASANSVAATLVSLRDCTPSPGSHKV